MLKLKIFMTTVFFLICSATVSIAGDAVYKDHNDLVEGDDYSIELIGGSPHGNHQLDCTVILPLRTANGDNSVPPEGGYPIIGWANGWGWNEVAGENEIAGYLPGMIEWAVNGQFIVVAANQWSPRERDVLQGVAWLIEQNLVEDGKYKGLVNVDKIGLSGHSQGGGAVLRAGDGAPKGVGLGLDFEITTVISMNPYGPAWNEVNPDGSVLIVGGLLDTTTPPDSCEAAWQRIVGNGLGGVNATHEEGDHNNNAWAKPGEYPEDCNFGEYQELTLEWWNYHLNGEDMALDRFCNILDDGEGGWDVSTSVEFDVCGE